MKKLIGLGIGVVSVIGLVASGTWAIFSDTETSGGGDVVYGCDVVPGSFVQGDRQDGSNVLADRSNPDEALGAPDGPGTPPNFVSLGFGGCIEIEFCEAICGEVTIWEITGGAYPPESATVQVSGSMDGDNYTLIGEATNLSGMPANSSHATTLPLGEACVKFIKICDTSNPALFANFPDADAFDLDAVEGTSCGNVFCAGIIDLEVDASNPDGSIIFSAQDDPLPPIFNYLPTNDLKPCASGEVTLSLHLKADSNPADLWIQVDNIGPCEEPSPVTEAECQCEGGVWSGGVCTDPNPDPTLGWVPQDDLCSQILVTLWIDDGGDGIWQNSDPELADDPLEGNNVLDANETVLTEPLDTLADLQPVDDEDPEILIPGAMPGTTYYVGWHWEIPCDLENCYQGDCCCFDIIFGANQLMPEPP